MKYILAFICCFIVNCGFRSGNSNLVPMYGSLDKPFLLKMADNKFIQDIKNQGLTLDSGSRKMASLGWSYLGRGDKETAALPAFVWMTPFLKGFFDLTFGS